MKEYFPYWLIFPFLFLGQVALAQVAPLRSMDQDADPEPHEITTMVDKEAEPEGGTDALLGYLSENIIFPEEAVAAGIQAKIIFKFIINQNGEMSNITIKDDPGYKLGATVKEALLNCPIKWKPAEYQGKKVPSYYVGSIYFKLD